MKLKYFVVALAMIVTGLVWAQLDQQSFRSFWWIVVIGDFALSGALYVVDGKVAS